MKRAEKQEVYRLLYEQYEDAGPELNFGSNFQLLIAVILSAQATDKRVNIVTEELFRVAPDAPSLAAMPLEEIREIIKTVGIYVNKSKYIKETARLLVEQFGGEVPQTREELMTLPGCSRKTANVVLSVAFGIPAIAVDTHVFRLSNRIGIAKGKDVFAVEQGLMKAFPKEQWYKLHHMLILHGRRVCKAQKPDCSNCRLNTHCDYFRKV